MKMLVIPVVLVSLLNVANAAIYQCEDSTGKVSFQDQPCANDETSTDVNINIPSQNTSKKSTQKAGNGSPAGQWVNAKDSRYKASLSAAGSFSMTDKRGDSLRGNWQESGGSYTVSAKFQGMSFPVNMKYEAQTDTLYLSKPGFPQAFRKYQRR